MKRALAAAAASSILLAGVSVVPVAGEAWIGVAGPHRAGIVACSLGQVAITEPYVDPNFGVGDNVLFESQVAGVQHHLQYWDGAAWQYLGTPSDWQYATVDDGMNFMLWYSLANNQQSGESGGWRWDATPGWYYRVMTVFYWWPVQGRADAAWAYDVSRDPAGNWSYCLGQANII